MNLPNSESNPFGDVLVDYPARVVMKAITYSTYTVGDQQSAITGVLDSLELKSFDWKQKNSKAGKYISHSFTVTITNSDQLKNVYVMLNNLDVVKMLL